LRYRAVPYYLLGNTMAEEVPVARLEFVEDPALPDRVQRMRGLGQCWFAPRSEAPSVWPPPERGMVPERREGPLVRPVSLAVDVAVKVIDALVGDAQAE